MLSRNYRKQDYIKTLFNSIDWESRTQKQTSKIIQLVSPLMTEQEAKTYLAFIRKQDHQDNQPAYRVVQSKKVPGKYRVAADVAKLQKFFPKDLTAIFNTYNIYVQTKFNKRCNWYTSATKQLVSEYMSKEDANTRLAFIQHMEPPENRHAYRVVESRTQSNKYRIVADLDKLQNIDLANCYKPLEDLADFLNKHLPKQSDGKWLVKCNQLTFETPYNIAQHNQTIISSNASSVADVDLCALFADSPPTNSQRNKSTPTTHTHDGLPPEVSVVLKTHGLGKLADIINQHAKYQFNATTISDDLSINDTAAMNQLFDIVEQYQHLYHKLQPNIGRIFAALFNAAPDVGRCIAESLDIRNIANLAVVNKKAAAAGLFNPKRTTAATHGDAAGETSTPQSPSIRPESRR